MDITLFLIKGTCNDNSHKATQNQMVTGQGYPLEKGTGELLRSFVPS